ncbi:MAG: HlyD family efflux transporter periplasmic adaptor subunit [Pirellulaceae bacterium]
MDDIQNRSSSFPHRNGTVSLWKLAVGLVTFCAIGWAALAIAGSFKEPELTPGLAHRVTRGNLVVTVNEQGLLESAENIEIKSKVRGYNTVLWIIESGSFVNVGDELVRIDSFPIQEQIDERTKYSNWSQSAADSTAAAVARSKIAVTEYEQGRYFAEVMTLEKDVAIAQAAVRNAGDRLRHVKAMAKSGYLNELEVEERSFAVEQAKLNLSLKKTQLEVLKKFTFKEQMQTLTGNLKSNLANHKANVERAMADNSRRDRAVDELQHCVIKADRSGLVIHPNAAKWETGPIAEGTNVHKDQVLLLMPDLKQMQVKVGVHESKVKRVKNGQKVKVTLPEGQIAGVVSDVASITKPAGWWTGNQVRYDTLVSLPPEDGLRPGMSADVEIVVAEHVDVLLIPVAAVIEHDDAAFCWVQSPAGPQRKQIEIGDTNDVFTIVNQGLQQGDAVLLNPMAYEQLTAESVREEDALKPQQL